MMAALPRHKHVVCVGSMTLNPKWLALLKAAALTLQHEGFAPNMVHMGFAQL